MPVERALISVYDKAGLADFASQLSKLGIEIVSTGGTARFLRDAGISVRDVAELTGSPEMLGGRVKTLHPKVHGGILFRRGNADDRKETAAHGIAPIDMVVVNLYPFSATASKSGVIAEELIENIDIGGPTMLRSAAKNFESVAVVTDPADYPALLEELAAARELRLSTRLDLARKAFALTARYDGLIATQLERLSADHHLQLAPALEALPLRLHFDFERQQGMRYGENPHQQAALYVPAGKPRAGFAAARQLQGKELSYNNLVDLDAAWSLASEFSSPAVAIIKHNNPCGAAEHSSLAEAYRQALACDPVSAFGSVIALNRPIDAATATELEKLFVECIAAPGFEKAALEILSAKKNLRLLEMAAAAPGADLELKRISGALLVQEPDHRSVAESEWKIVTDRQPTPPERHAMRFAWIVCKHVKSNAIVFARDGQTLGIGAGQMSRVDSVKLAVMKAQMPLAGTVVASDAFFPFPDGVEEAAKAGAVAVVQPGGSVRDNEVIAAANRLGLAMVFTGVRHFRH
ncbi:MAG: bifunctional phosphoribosylaminoimidazolecarboxamide formyltransferase/IMP cyclohydrolase [Candidatus Acidiferrales bacterium]